MMTMCRLKIIHVILVWLSLIVKNLKSIIKKDDVMLCRCSKTLFLWPCNFCERVGLMFSQRFVLACLGVVLFPFLVFDTKFCAHAENEIPLAVDSRIKTFIYTATQIFPIKVNYGYQTFIEFSPSETIKTIAAGDAISWAITPSGNRIFIKALEKSGKTNLTVITSKRSYIFDLVAKENTDEVDKELTYYVRFYYPEKSDDSSDESDSLLPTFDPKKVLSRNYHFAGEKSLQPVDVFDNGNVTFFKFTGNVPKIFILKDDNIEYASKMVLWGDYIVIDGVHKNVTLRYKDSFAKLTNTKKK